jgi:hypothetical protein
MTDLNRFTDFLDKAGIGYNLKTRSDGQKEVLIDSSHAKVEAFIDFNAKFIFIDDGSVLKVQSVPPL